MYVSKLKLVFIFFTGWQCTNAQSTSRQCFDFVDCGFGGPNVCAPVCRANGCRGSSKCVRNMECCCEGCPAPFSK